MKIFKNRQKISIKRSERSAQSSIFLIIGITVFILMFAGYFAYTNLKKSEADTAAKKTTELNLQAEEIKKYINDCIRKESFDALKKMGQTGGYIDVPNIINFKGVAIWHLDQVNIQPFLNQTQERLIGYVNTNIPKCIDNENITKLGFVIEKGEPTTVIEFGNADVTLKVFYPVKATKGDFSKDFFEFFNTFDIRYRAVFEGATAVNSRLFDADFDAREPLKKLEYMGNLDLGVEYKAPETDMMTFTITDQKSVTPESKNYQFSFAAKLGKSDLKKITDLQNKSATNPTFLSFAAYSVDRKAQLDISSGTTINLNGSDVPGISVQQAYPSEVVTKDVPVYKKNKDVIQKQDIKYIIDNPIYTFEPSGLLFNKYEKLTLYYDPAENDSEGMGVLMGKKGFWVPIPSKHEPEQKRVFSSILGFTEFTALNCATQTAKQTIAEHYFEPNAGCYITLAVMIIAMIFTFGVLGVALAGVEGVAVAAAGTVTIEGAASVSVGFIEAFTTSLASTLATTATVGGVSLGVTIGTISAALFVISTAATIIGATTDAFYSHSPDQCETFYPSCDQTITVVESGNAADGKCVPNPGPNDVKAGQPVTVCAQVQSCGFVQKFICLKCSQICTARFK